MCSMQRWQQQALKRAIRGVDFPGFRFAANLLPHLQAARSGVRGENYQLWVQGAHRTWSPRGAHVKHMGETARRTMTQTQFSRHFSTCIGPVLLDWIERNLRRVPPLLPVQILCVCLPFKFACRPANDKPISVKVLTVKACFLPAFAALGANGSESIQRRVW